MILAVIRLLKCIKHRVNIHSLYLAFQEYVTFWCNNKVEVLDKVRTCALAIQIVRLNVVHVSFTRSFDYYLVF